MCKIDTRITASDNTCNVNVRKYPHSASGWTVEEVGQSTTLAARFWSKVAIGSDSECWPWHGDLGTRGYGQINVDGQNVGAHRIAFWLAKGEAIKGFIIRHSCDNPPCCNPAHLTRGTQKENVHDAIQKGRHVHPDWRLRKHTRNGHSRKAAAQPCA